MMSLYLNKKQRISSTYENRKQLQIASKLYHHKTNIGFWSYDEGIPVFTPFDNEVFLCSKK